MSKYSAQANSKLYKKFIRNWYWFILCLGIAIAYAWYDLAQQPNTWYVAGSIIVEEEKGANSSLPEESFIGGVPFMNRGNLDRQIQLLKSKKLMEKVVDSLGIDILYFLERRFLEEELYKKSHIKVAEVSDRDAAYGTNLRVRKIDDSRFSLIRGENDTLFYNFGVPFVQNGVSFTLQRDTTVTELDGVISIRFIPPSSVASWYANLINFQKQGQSNILTVSLSDITPEKLSDIIYELVEVYNVYAQQEKNKIAGRSLDFINERLDNLSSDLFTVENQQAAVKSGSSVTTDVEASAERFINKLNAAEEKLGEIANTRRTIENLERFLLNRDNEYTLVPNFGELAGISFSSEISRYNSLLTARERLLISVTVRHPDVQNINDKLPKLRNSILNSILLVKNDLSSQENELLAETAPVERKVSSLPFAQKRINEISRQVDVKSDLVTFMLKKREETAIGLVTQVESARILDDPVSSGVPVGPNKGQMYFLAALFGLAFPAGVIYLRDRLNDKISTKAELKALTTVPFLGEVAYAKSERSRLISSNSRSVLGEMFRLIRTNLQFITTGSKDKTILVTSNVSGDGKTFFSGNLAVCLALTNKKTVMLELDLRKPKLTEFIMKEPSVSGITNYLVGEKEISDIIKPVEGYDHLYLISSGPAPPNPAELIMSERMDELFSYLKQNFDYIVIDSPPTGLVTDAYLLNRFASNSIFVVRSGKTKKGDLQNIEDIYKEGKLVNPSIILNGVKMPKRYGYYY